MVLAAPTPAGEEPNRYGLMDQPLQTGNNEGAQTDPSFFLFLGPSYHNHASQVHPYGEPVFPSEREYNQQYYPAASQAQEFVNVGYDSHVVNYPYQPLNPTATAMPIHHHPNLPLNLSLEPPNAYLQRHAQADHQNHARRRHLADGRVGDEEVRAGNHERDSILEDAQSNSKTDIQPGQVTEERVGSARGRRQRGEKALQSQAEGSSRQADGSIGLIPSASDQELYLFVQRYMARYMSDEFTVNEGHAVDRNHSMSASLKAMNSNQREWICTALYGGLLDAKREKELIIPEDKLAEIIETFKRYEEEQAQYNRD